MLDKEKIFEMASDMDYGCTKHDLWPEDAKEIAKALTILGYQKINEDDIIISKKEYERLHSIEIAFEEFAKPDGVLIPVEEYEKLQTDMRRLGYQNCNLTIENKNLKENLEVEILKGKETAEKIRDMAKQKSFPTWLNVDDNPRKESLILLSDIDKIIKSLGVEIKE